MEEDGGSFGGLFEDEVVVHFWQAGDEVDELMVEDGVAVLSLSELAILRVRVFGSSVSCHLISALLCKKEVYSQN